MTTLVWLFFILSFLLGVYLSYKFTSYRYNRKLRKLFSSIAFIVPDKERKTLLDLGEKLFKNI